MSVFITKKKTFLQYICKLYRMQCCVVKDAQNKIIPHIQGGAHFNNCSHRVFYHRPILCCHNYVLQYLGNNNVFQSLAEAQKKPPPRAICYLPRHPRGPSTQQVPIHTLYK